MSSPSTWLHPAGLIAMPVRHLCRRAGIAGCTCSMIDCAQRQHKGSLCAATPGLAAGGPGGQAVTAALGKAAEWGPCCLPTFPSGSCRLNWHPVQCCLGTVCLKVAWHSDVLLHVGALGGAVGTAYTGGSLLRLHLGDMRALCAFRVHLSAPCKWVRHWLLPF